MTIRIDLLTEGMKGEDFIKWEPRRYLRADIEGCRQIAHDQSSLDSGKFLIQRLCLCLTGPGGLVTSIYTKR
jgi:hypothetical protein